MKDVLDTISVLPPQCASVMNGEAVFIRRGAREPDPAFMPVEQVPAWNIAHDVTPEQQTAMEVGVSLGWDLDGAHTDGVCETFTFTVTLAMTIKVDAASPEDAARLARVEAQTLLTEVGLDAVVDCVDQMEP